MLQRCRTTPARYRLTNGLILTALLDAFRPDTSAKRDTLSMHDPREAGSTAVAVAAIDALKKSESDPVEHRLRSLCRAAGRHLPRSGGGDTLSRWRVLSEVGGADLSLARLFEGHVDAVAILEEVAAASTDASETWGVWAAETRARVQLGTTTGDRAHVSGVKSWCSGAPFLSHALITAWRGDDGPFLVAVPLAQAGVEPRRGAWAAVGMAQSDSWEVQFSDARGVIIGDPGAYLARPGFWHGAIGVAACWLGGAIALGEIARRHMPDDGDPIRASHLGTIDAALSQARDVMRAAAAWIDTHPTADARLCALRTRWSVEAAADIVLRHAGRLLGASAFCLNPAFARLAADLPVYIRQSHAEHDLALVGRTAKEQEPGTWAL